MQLAPPSDPLFQQHFFGQTFVEHSHTSASPLRGLMIQDHATESGIGDSSKCASSRALLPPDLQQGGKVKAMRKGQSVREFLNKTVPGLGEQVGDIL